MAHFDMLIQPEEGSGVFPVSLWAIRGVGAGQRLYCAPQGSWLEYSRRFEQTKLMDARTLGHADACIFRGEPVIQPIQCSPLDLARMGFGDAQVNLPKHLRLNAILSRREEVFVSGKKAVDPASASPAQFDFDSEPPITLAASADLTADELYGDMSIFSERDAVFSTTLEAGDHSQLLSSTVASDIDLTATVSHRFRNRVALLGVGIDNLSMDVVVELIDGLIEQGGCHQVATANVDFLTKAFDDGELLDILHNCELVVADGMPLVWASRILGAPLKERVAGADLVPRLLELSARKKRRIFLLGASEENSFAAAENIAQDFPGAVVCGRYSPPFTPGVPVEDELILQLIAEAKPDLLLVAFGNPKQEKWIARHLDRLNVPVCIGVGASIDFLSGRQSRAPKWMQRSGLEWTYRMINEPRRLALRYLNNGLFLLRYLSVQLVANSLQPRTLQEPQVSLDWHGGVLTVAIAGGFCGSVSKELFEQLERLNHDGPLVLDLTSTAYIAPDAAGLLIYLAQRCGRSGSELWIAGGRSALLSALQATFPAGEPFRIAMTLQDALRFVSTPSLYKPRPRGLRSEAA
jgi:N-acetylglucosaminyldiphosphoundecaprenol N-acetyl-beta-D-mannosaminyltransferase